MYVDTATYIRSGKRLKRHLLRESYREEGKVKKRTIASLCSLTEEEIQAIKLALRHKSNLHKLTSSDAIESKQGKSYGAIKLLKFLSEVMGITKILGNSNQGKLAIWQILGRVLFQGSRQTLLRGLDIHLAEEILGLGRVTAKRLYTNLCWLEQHQVKMEKRLRHRNKSTDNLYLYDVTSSDLEGQKNELSAYGYNRDKKRGKKQIVIGLLTDGTGYPIAVRVFKGNTSDSKTVSDQIELLQKEFKVKKVTLVGDKAMFSKEKMDNFPKDFSFITSISKCQINKLIREKELQLSLFDNDIKEVETEDKRNIFRCNPIRKQEMIASRNSKIESIKTLVSEKNQYLNEHKKAKIEIALHDLNNKAKKLGIDKFIIFDMNNRTISYSVVREEIDKASQLDGCYCLITNVCASQVDKDTIHARYKDLSLVESAFRTMKQSHLEIRPVFLRREDRTKAHVFITMLAFIIQKKLSEYWKNINITVSEGLTALSTLTTSVVKFADVEINKFNQPNELCKKLLIAANVDLTKFVPTNFAKN
jgi:transposase